MNQDWSECKNLIAKDYRRLNPIRLGYFRYLLTNASFRMTFWMRIGNYLRQKGGLFKLLYAIVVIIYKQNTWKTGIQMPMGMNIGPGVYFPHFGSIVMNDKVKIGRNCTIFQCVTLGYTPPNGVPTIGDNVTLYAGAKIIGGVTIGNDVIVGAGAVVVNDVPDGAIVVGVPAKIVSMKGKEKCEYKFND